MSLTIPIGLVALAIVIGARFMPLDRAPASTAIVVWLCTLFVGAAATIAAAAFALAYLPQTSFYALVAELCLHSTVPFVRPHLVFSGHVALHVAMILPSLALACSAVWLVTRVANGWWRLRSRLREAGTSKEGCSVIQDDEIVMGVAPVGRGRIIVSDTTLRTMDDQEFEASLSHELGHLRRGHRPIMLISRALAALSFPFPGSRQARDQLLQALERDADEYAVRQNRDPLALASAISKAATGPRPIGEIELAGGVVSRRLDYLEGGVQLAGPTQRRAVRAFCSMFVTGTLTFAVVVVMWAQQLPVAGHNWMPGGVVC